MTLYELGLLITKIREAVNELEVKGQRNASIVVYCHEQCNAVIQAINESCAGAADSAGKETDGDLNEPDPGISQ